MRPLGSSFWWAAYRVLRRRLLMSIDQESAHRIATQLEQSVRSRQHITQLSTAYPQLSIADAYAVQQAWVALKMSQGRSIEGHKRSEERRVGKECRTRWSRDAEEEEERGRRCEGGDSVE